MNAFLAGIPAATHLSPQALLGADTLICGLVLLGILLRTVGGRR